MTGEAAPESVNQQALWDEVAKEREAADDSAPSTAPTVTDDTANDLPTEQAKSDESAPEAKAEEPKPDDKPAAPPTPADPYEGLSPAVRAKLERLDALEAQVAQLPDLVNHVKRTEGRVAGVQRELEAAKAAAKTVTTGPTQAQIDAAKVSTEKWNTLKADFPEWANATEEFVAAKLASLPPQGEQFDPARVDQLIEERLKAVRAETAAAVEVAKVEGKYADWQNIVQTAEFKTWFNAQANETKALASSPRGRDAIRMLDLYHEALATPADAVQKEREKKLAAAVTTKPGAQANVTKTVDQMSPQELWEYERKRNEKRGAAIGLKY